jgi:hypothetical protein
MSVDGAVQLAVAVRAWADRTAPGASLLGDRTVLVALTEYVGGATAADAGAAARTFLLARSAHPSAGSDAEASDELAGLVPASLDCHADVTAREHATSRSDNRMEGMADVIPIGRVLLHPHGHGANDDWKRTAH